MWPSYTLELLHKLQPSKILNLAPKRINQQARKALFSGEKIKSTEFAKKYGLVPTIPADEAVAKHLNKDGLFISVFNETTVSIPNFHNFSASDVKYQLKKIEELAKDHNDIYIIDEHGGTSQWVAYMLNQSETFKSKNVRVIQGGLGLWLYEGGQRDMKTPYENARARITNEINNLMEDPGKYGKDNSFATYFLEQVNVKNEVNIDTENGVIELTDNIEQISQEEAYDKLNKVIRELK